MNIKTDNAQFMEQFEYLLDMPDDMFKSVYPELIKELRKSAKSGELDAVVITGISAEDKQKAREELVTLQKLLDSPENDLSKEKSVFLDELLQLSIDKLDELPYRDTVKVQVELVSENAKLPTYAHYMDAGCDVYAAAEATIEPNSTVIVPTGLRLAIPDGWMVSVRPRSGLSAKTGLRVANAPGTIDSNFRGEVGIIVHNTSDTIATIALGDRIAQFVIEKCPRIDFKVVESLDATDRGEGGFGSSGN